MVTKQITKIVVDKSIENINNVIHECTESLSAEDIISKSQIISMLRKIRSFEIPDEVFDDKSLAEHYAEELLKIDFLENIKQIFRTIFNKSNFSTLDLSNIRIEMEFSCFKINSLGKILKEREINIWGGSYPAIKIDFISENGNYIVK
jgi:hypothetical protein